MLFKKTNQPDQEAMNAFLYQQYSAMPLDKLQELANNLSAQLMLINSIIHEKCPDQEV